MFTTAQSGFLQLGTSNGVSNVSDYTGKTVKFKVDVNPSYQVRLRVYQYVNGAWQSVSSDYTSTSATLELQASINASATRVSFRVDCGNNNSGETVKINNWKVYPI